LVLRNIFQRSGKFSGEDFNVWQKFSESYYYIFRAYQTSVAIYFHIPRVNLDLRQKFCSNRIQAAAGNFVGCVAAAAAAAVRRRLYFHSRVKPWAAILMTPRQHTSHLFCASSNFPLQTRRFLVCF